MAITIRKIKTPKYASINNKSVVFYRVSNNGVYVQDFKKKSDAINLVSKMTKKK